MEGAIAASAHLDRSAAVMAALVIGFDFAVREGLPPLRRDAESLEQVRARRHTLAGDLGEVDPDELAAPLLHPAVDEPCRRPRHPRS
jgi:hypothetical protein